MKITIKYCFYYSFIVDYLSNYNNKIDQKYIKMSIISKIYNSTDNRLIITGKCGSGKSIAILCYIYLKYIKQILLNKETIKEISNTETNTEIKEIGKEIEIKKQILFVQPTNNLVEFQRSQVNLISRIFKEIKFNNTCKSKIKYWIDKFNLRSFSDILNSITEDDFNIVSKSLTESIVNPEKACHIIFDAECDKSEVIIDEYHIDNIFYKILIIELTFGKLQNFNTIKYISGTPKQIQDKIETIEIPSSDISSKIYSIKFEFLDKISDKFKLKHLINDECNEERIQKFYETVVKNNGTILIISTSKTENKKQKYILQFIEFKLISINPDININKIIVNSENPYLNKLILDDKVNIIISSPNSLTSGITIDRLIIVYDFGIYPVPPSMLSLKILIRLSIKFDDLSNNAVKFYRNSEETTEQIKHRLGRSGFDGLYILDKESNKCQSQTKYNDYLHHLILKKTYHDYNIYNHVKEMVNSTTPTSKYFEWIEDTYGLMWNIFENIYDVFYPSQEDVNDNQEDDNDELYGEIDTTTYNQIKGERIDKIFQIMINHEKDLANFNKIEKPKTNFNIACRLIYTYVYMNIELDDKDQKYKISNLIIDILSQPQSNFNDKIITPKSYFKYFNQQLDFQISDNDLQIIEKSFETFIRPINNRTISQRTSQQTR